MKQSLYKLALATMITLSSTAATQAQTQGCVDAQKGDKSFTLEDLNFGGKNITTCRPKTAGVHGGATN